MEKLHAILRLIARGLSYLFYPLLMPTYGMLLFCWGLSPLVGNQLPLSAWLVCVGTTFVMTLLIPLSAIAIRMWRGKISNLYLSNPVQRTVPYIYGILCFCFWCYFVIVVLQSPMYLNLTVIGATIALIIVLIINLKWKISAHLTGLGGLIGGVMSHYLMGSGGPVWLPIVLMVCALLLMYARIYLKEHNELQVIAGLLLGLCCTFIPNMFLAYVS